jgi:hypothetical protein
MRRVGRRREEPGSLGEIDDVAPLVAFPMRPAGALDHRTDAPRQRRHGLTGILTGALLIPDHHP